MTARFSRYATTCAAILLVSLVWTGCASPEPPAGDAAPPAVPERPATLVETVTLQSAPFIEVLTLTGETAPIRSAVLSSQAPGRIVALDLVEGELVRAGASVLRVDTSTLASQRAQLETQLAAIERDITRGEALIDRGIGTRFDLEQRRTEQQLVRDQLASLDTNLAQGRMVAPITGIVTQKLAEVDEFANPGVPLARIVDVSTLVVRVGLPERELAAVREGMDVEVLITSTGQRVSGRLHRIGVEGDVASRTFPIEVHIDNASGELRAGMRCAVSFAKRSFPDAIVVPRDAVLQGLEGPEVLVDGGGVAEKRAVVVGPGRGALTVITEGLAVGDKLIVRGHRILVPSEVIRSVDLGPCCAAQLAAVLGAPAAPDAAAAAGAPEGSGR